MDETVLEKGTGRAPEFAVQKIGIDPADAKFIENFLGALDTPGEWFLKRSGYLYYIPREGETPGNTTFHIPIFREFVVIRGGAGEDALVKNIRFENLVIETAGLSDTLRRERARPGSRPCRCSHHGRLCRQYCLQHPFAA